MEFLTDLKVRTIPVIFQEKLFLRILEFRDFDYEINSTKNDSLSYAPQYF